MHGSAENLIVCVFLSGAIDDHEKIKALFPSTYGIPRVELVPGVENDAVMNPLRVGCVLSGGQAPGGHNVIAGIFDYAMACNPESFVAGFLNGPAGIMNGTYTRITAKMMDRFRNTGGFDMLGSGRGKIETEEQMLASMRVCQELDLDGLIVIGGDDSNTNAALLSEFFRSRNCKTKVNGCPKTIDGDLKNKYIPVSFGFDTACKTFSEQLGNLSLDVLGSQKYYHFIRVMGRAASNIALECALQTRPNMCLISEEVEAKAWSLQEVTRQIVDMIVARSKSGKNYGIVVFPEGLIEFIPEFSALISDINDVLASGIPPIEENVTNALSQANKGVFCSLPSSIKSQLLLDRDPHGNVQVAKIETEQLLSMMVADSLSDLRLKGIYSGQFTPQYQNFGYEGRCAIPSHFDSSYCYTLGYTAAALTAKGLNSLMASVDNMHGPIEDWTIGGVPIVMMCHMERRKGKNKPVIKKALVDLDGEPFKALAKYRQKWAMDDLYRAPGPIQFYSTGSRDINFTLLYELLGEEADEITECSTPTSVIKPITMGEQRFIYRPFSRGMRSAQERARLEYKPSVPPCLASRSAKHVSMVEDERTSCANARDREPLLKVFPKTYGLPLIQMESDFHMFDQAIKGPRSTVGVVFCGRPASGAHNVIAGLHDFLKDSNSHILGFVGGTRGLFNGDHVAITDEILDNYLNQGGVDLLGRSVESILTIDEMSQVCHTCEILKLDGLILIGGNQTNTDAAFLAEKFKEDGVQTCIVSVPCSVSGSMRNQFVEQAVGFDTAVKVCSQLAGNTAIDGASARKYWYFVRIMGQDSSHSTLEVALQCNPNVVMLSEEVYSRRLTLHDIVRKISDVVQVRAEAGKQFGTVLIPDGLVQSIPEMAVLIEEIDDMYKEKYQKTGDMTTAIELEEVTPRLTKWSEALMRSLPQCIKQQLCLVRQSNFRLQLGQIETEKMLAYFVEGELKKRKAASVYSGKFSAVCSYLGYQARSALPSNFDCDLAYGLGGTAAVLIHNRLSGYCAVVSNSYFELKRIQPVRSIPNGYLWVPSSQMSGLKEPVSNWKPGGVPLTAMLVCDGVEKVGKMWISNSVPAAFFICCPCAYSSYALPGASYRPAQTSYPSPHGKP